MNQRHVLLGQNAGSWVVDSPYRIATGTKTEMEALRVERRKQDNLAGRYSISYWVEKDEETGV